MDQVNREAMVKMNHVITFVPTYDRTLTQQIFTVDDFSNQILMHQLRQIMNKKIRLNECTTRHFITSSDVSRHFYHTVSVHWPRKNIDQRHVALEEFIDYFVYLASCIGLWFEFSFFSITNSIKYLSKVMKRSGSDHKCKHAQHRLKLSNVLKRQKVFDDEMRDLKLRINHILSLNSDPISSASPRR